MPNVPQVTLWTRFVAMLLIGFGILQVPFPTLKHTLVNTIVEIGVGVVAVAAIPLVAKLWPIPGEQPISMKMWTFILTMMLVGGVTIKMQDNWFPDYPSIGKWLVAGMFVVAGMSVVFLRRRNAGNT